MEKLTTMDGIADSSATSFILMLAILLTAAAYSTAIAADDTVPLKAHWEYYATIHHIDNPVSPPTHSSYMGPSSYYTYNIDPTKVVYLEWYKAEFLETQQEGKNPYKTEFMLIKVDCARRVYRVMRDVKYAPDGAVVRDEQIPGVTRPYRLGVDGDKVPLSEEFAATLDDALCGRSGD